MTHERGDLLATALRLSVISASLGAAIGALSVTAGLLDHSLGVLGSGLGVLADLVGSLALIWRFRAERSDLERAERVERRAGQVVAAALALVAAALTVAAVAALADGSHPGTSAPALTAACVAIVLLPPLAHRKRRTADALASHALRGDSTLTAVGAATALLALVGLLLSRAFGWWWADRVVALVVAAAAAVESRRVARGSEPF